MSAPPTLARRIFRLAGYYGILVLLPQYLLETGLIPAPPGPIGRPEVFYGFVGVALAWQFAFIVIGGNPVRFRPLMLVAVLEKLAYGVPVVLLYVTGRTGADVLVFGIIDLLLGALFVLAYVRTPTALEPRALAA